MYANCGSLHTIRSKECPTKKAVLQKSKEDALSYGAFYPVWDAPSSQSSSLLNPLDGARAASYSHSSQSRDSNLDGRDGVRLLRQASRLPAPRSEERNLSPGKRARISDSPDRLIGTFAYDTAMANALPASEEDEDADSEDGTTTNASQSREERYANRKKKQQLESSALEKGQAAYAAKIAYLLPSLTMKAMGRSSSPRKGTLGSSQPVIP